MVGEVSDDGDVLAEAGLAPAEEHVDERGGREIAVEGAKEGDVGFAEDMEVCEAEVDVEVERRVQDRGPMEQWWGCGVAVVDVAALAHDGGQTGHLLPFRASRPVVVSATAEERVACTGEILEELSMLSYLGLMMFAGREALDQWWSRGNERGDTDLEVVHGEG